jgi:hypothetical protein
MGTSTYGRMSLALMSAQMTLEGREEEKEKGMERGEWDG